MWLGLHFNDEFSFLEILDGLLGHILKLQGADLLQQHLHLVLYIGYLSYTT